jgi:enoyl-[acyl-carrier-protein] reductase (NADH)
MCHTSLTHTAHTPDIYTRTTQIRVNTISAGPLGSRAAKAIGFIDDMIRYSYANAPMQKELAAQVCRCGVCACSCARMLLCSPPAPQVL